MRVSPGTLELTRTLNLSCAASLGLSAPPAVAEAPRPARMTRRFVAGTYSAISSPAASVIVPIGWVGGPEITRNEPGTYVTFGGRLSTTVVFKAPSCPILPKSRVYSISSPGIKAPPLRSTPTFLNVSFTLGTKISVTKVTTPKSIVSEEEDTRIAAVVTLLPKGVLGLNMSAS